MYQQIIICGLELIQIEPAVKCLKNKYVNKAKNEL